MYTMGIDVGSSSSKAVILRDGRVEIAQCRTHYGA